MKNNALTLFNPLKIQSPNGWFDNFFLQTFDNFGHNLTPQIKETSQNATLEFNVPGFKKNEIKIEYENGLISISAEKQGKNDCRSINQSLYIGEKYDMTGATAKIEDGVLFIILPKLEKHKPKVIDVQ